MFIFITPTPPRPIIKPASVTEKKCTIIKWLELRPVALETLVINGFLVDISHYQLCHDITGWYSFDLHHLQIEFNVFTQYDIL
jgi:hypothetical protein